MQARYPQVRTTIPPGLSEAVKAWDDVALSYRPTGQLCDRFVHDDTLTVDGTVRLGPYDWSVLPADGHDADMVMLWCETQGVLISADALWQNGFGVLFPALNGDLGAFAAQDQTLELIEQLAPRLVIPGHGAPFTEVDRALQTARSRLNWLAQDPRRHAQAALKGLLAFTLLDRQHMPHQDVIDLIDHGLMSQPGFKAAFDEAPPIGPVGRGPVDPRGRGPLGWSGPSILRLRNRSSNRPITSACKFVPSKRIRRHNPGFVFHGVCSPCPRPPRRLPIPRILR